MKHRYNIDMVRWSHYDESCVKGLNWKWNIKLFEVWGRGSLQKKEDSIGSRVLFFFNPAADLREIVWIFHLEKRNPSHII